VTPLRPGKCQSARPLNETCRGELRFIAIHFPERSVVK
jgi:hypothetical protein